MNKNFLALVAFASLVVVGCDNAQQTPSAEPAPSASTSDVTAPHNNNIVYIDTDSLVRGYQHFKDLKSKFDTKAATVQKELETKTRSLERKVADYQNKIQKGLVTRAQAAELEQSLNTEQQQVLQYRDQVLAELQEEEQVLFNNVNNDITEYIAKFNEEKTYDLILTTNAVNNTVLIGNKNLDITTTVLDGMNAEYSSRAK
ncbi:MAG: OmpH family outer membrane protein [Rikenellaceae bacterium]